MWILIIFGFNGHGAIATTELGGQQNCLEAVKQINAVVGYSNNKYSAICVPKTQYTRDNAK